MRTSRVTAEGGPSVWGIARLSRFVTGPGVTSRSARRPGRAPGAGRHVPRGQGLGEQGDGLRGTLPGSGRGAQPDSSAGHSEGGRWPPGISHDSSTANPKSASDRSAPQFPQSSWRRSSRKHWSPDAAGHSQPCQQPPASQRGHTARRVRGHSRGRRVRPRLHGVAGAAELTLPPALLSPRGHGSLGWGPQGLQDSQQGRLPGPADSRPECGARGHHDWGRPPPPPGTRRACLPLTGVRLTARTGPRRGRSPGGGALPFQTQKAHGELPPGASEAAGRTRAVCGGRAPWAPSCGVTGAHAGGGGSGSEGEGGSSRPAVPQHDRPGGPGPAGAAGGGLGKEAPSRRPPCEAV